MQTVQMQGRTWRWTRETSFSEDSRLDSISWYCDGGTDYWRLTASEAVAHNGHSCLVPADGDFTIQGEFTAELSAQYDQVGLIAIRDPAEWFKGGFELDGPVYVGGVHTRGTSDWSLAPARIPAGLMLSRNSGAMELRWRAHGEDWALIRQLTLEGPLQVGFYSASPLGRGFRATVSRLLLSLPS